MQTNKRQAMKETGYTQVDNKIFDAQPFLSPAAFGVLIRMVRMIEGYGNDDSGLSNTFLQDNCNLSKNTVSKAVAELVKFGFLNQKKQQRTTTIYSLNYENIAAFDAKKHGQNLASQNLASQNLTIRFPKSDLVSSQNLGRNKENKRKPFKENYKKGNEKTDSPKSYQPKKPESVSEQIWSDLLSHRKSKKTSNTQTAWTTIFNALGKAQSATGHSLDSIITEWIARDWKGFKADWYINAQPSPQQTTYQGTRYENNQQPSHNRQQPVKQSSADAYEENLARELAERFPDEFPAADHCF